MLDRKAPLFKAFTDNVADSAMSQSSRDQYAHVRLARPLLSHHRLAKVATTTVGWRRAVAGIDERVAYLEGRVEEHGHMVNGTRDAIVSLQSRMVSFEARVDQRLQSFEVRLQTFETRVDHRFLAIDSRFDAMDAKITRYFTWLIGLYVTGLIAIFSTLVAVVAR